ncbi:Sec-independent protein translocase subunit TatA [Knoellia sp. 3-2P3]|uniref:Sec-independent protein translocase subunit TatA n=1 Tax=unclassified Knoellia TaxID=2618719 RepID=UPI0023DB1FCB|nr:Sec-independent protein translocase subunit TatA [Knoellia sp. 3-2P3]MDF2092016.1 Sec-independent protein translocase subunit TatA [Knoellia sp. 3-2P3]
MPNLGPTELIIIAVVVVLLFGWKKLPDAARSLGRSMRIFKSEVSEMKNDGKSAASSDTVRGETVREDAPRKDNQPGSAGTTPGHPSPGTTTPGSTGSTGTGTSGPIS